MPQSLELALGALEIGTWFSVYLYGVITLQVYIYTQAEIKDHLVIRFLVGTMWVLDTVHTVFLCVWIYQITATTNGQIVVVEEIHWALLAVLILNGVMAIVVQSYFAYRIRIISYQWPICVLSWLVCAARMAIITTIVVLGANVDTLPEYLQKYNWIVPTAISILCFGDVLNTSALCFYLYKKRQQSTRAIRLINKLILWAVETGLITTVCGIVVLVLTVTKQETLTWLALYLFFPKFYSISLLTSLNNRPYLRRLDSASRGGGTLPSAMQFSIGRKETTHIEMAPTDSGSGDDWSGPAPVQKAVRLVDLQFTPF